MDVEPIDRYASVEAILPTDRLQPAQVAEREGPHAGDAGRSHLGPIGQTMERDAADLDRRGLRAEIEVDPHIVAVVRRHELVGHHLPRGLRGKRGVPAEVIPRVLGPGHPGAERPRAVTAQIQSHAVPLSLLQPVPPRRD